VPPGGAQPIAAEVPADKPFFLRLETFRRANNAYDWATWRLPQLAACNPR
jgi:hypothetical protein